MNRYLRLAAVVLLSLQHAASLAQQAAPRDLKGKADIKDCYQVVKADSVLMYYDHAYRLSPVACASIRRQCHLDGTGFFRGAVLDYDIRDNRLLGRLTYAGGQRHGLSEEYHPNGKLAMRGQYLRDRPTGLWQYWYANGQPRQSFLWNDSTGEMKIVAYWDSTGQQLAANGQGKWFDRHYSSKHPYGGPVMDGKAHGVWESRNHRNNELLATEEYKAGAFVMGQDYLVAGGRRGPTKYKDRAMLMPIAPEFARDAEDFHLTETCEQQAANRRASSARRRTASMKLVAPTTKGGLGLYNRSLLDRLRRHAERDNWYTAFKGKLAMEIEVGVDGQLQSFRSERDSRLAQIVYDMMSQMLQHWEPATADGRPVPGLLHVEVEVLESSVSSRLRAAVKLPLPAAAVPAAEQTQGGMRTPAEAN